MEKPDGFRFAGLSDEELSRLQEMERFLAEKGATFIESNGNREAH